MHTQVNKAHSVLPWIFWFPVALFFSYEMFQLTTLNSIQTELTPILNLTGWRMAVFSSSYLYLCAIFIIPAGLLIDNFKLKPLLLTTLLLSILGTYLIAITNNLWVASLGRALTGIGNGFAFLGCMKIISDWFSEKSAYIARGLTYTVGMFGCIISQAPLKALVQKTSLSFSLYMICAVGILLFITVVCIVKQPQRIQHSNFARFPRHLKLALTNKQNFFCGIYACLINLPTVLFGALWGNDFLTQRYHIDQLTASKICSTIFLGMMLGAIIIAWLSDLIKKNRLMMFSIAGLSCLAILAMIIFPISLWQMVVLFFLLGMFSCAQLISYYIVTKLNPHHVEETSMSIVTTMINIGGAFLQVFFSSITAYANSNTTLAACLAIFFICLLSVFLIREKQQAK